MRPETRLEFLTPKFHKAELECQDAPRGQLPATASSETVSERIIGIDESGEDCRQKLGRVKMKIEVYDEVRAEYAKTQKVKKK